MTTAEQALVRAAARNNAEFCATVCRSHGVTGEFGPRAWTASARTPMYYPDAVTLVPRADVGELLARIDTTRPGASVKDSFADLDLTGAGFEVLFDAQWIHRPANTPSPESDLAWEVVGTADMLREWAQAWDDGDGDADVFRPALLDDPDTYVLASQGADGRIVAGAVATRSERAVGVSNIFAAQRGTDAAWPMALDAMSQLFPTLLVVGYEHGECLDAALRHGFEAIGALRIWVAPARSTSTGR